MIYVLSTAAFLWLVWLTHSIHCLCVAVKVSQRHSLTVGKNVREQGELNDAQHQLNLAQQRSA